MDFKAKKNKNLITVNKVSATVAEIAHKRFNPITGEADDVFVEIIDKAHLLNLKKDLESKIADINEQLKEFE